MRKVQICKCPTSVGKASTSSWYLTYLLTLYLSVCKCLRSKLIPRDPLPQGAHYATTSSRPYFEQVQGRVFRACLHCAIHADLQRFALCGLNDHPSSRLEHHGTPASYSAGVPGCFFLSAQTRYLPLRLGEPTAPVPPSTHAEPF